MIEVELARKAAQAHALLAELAAAVSTDTAGPLAAEILPEILGAVRQGELATCRLVERVDRTGEFASEGANSTVSYLRNLSGESNPWASERVQLGRALADRMPADSDRVAEAGDLGLTQASIIRKATCTLEADLAAEIEAALAEAAPHISVRQLSDLAEVVKAAAAPDDAQAAAKKNRDNQTLSISKTFDGRYRLDGWLDTEAGAEVAAAIEAFTRKRDPNLSIVDDPIGRRRAEALRQIARHAIAHADGCNGDGSSRHNLLVTISLEALASGIGSADIQGRGVITASAARRLACDYGIIPAVLGTESEILDLGVPNRLATPKQRRNIAIRDGGCLFPGCDRPPVGCDAHHRIHHIDGGPTAEHNLDSFCVFHHHQVHEGGWTYEIIDAGHPRVLPTRRRPPNPQQTPQLPRPGPQPAPAPRTHHPPRKTL